MEKPLTYNDDLLDEKARKVIANGLDAIQALLDKEKRGESWSPDKMVALSDAVDAASGIASLEDDDDENERD